MLKSQSACMKNAPYFVESKLIKVSLSSFPAASDPHLFWNAQILGHKSATLGWSS